LKGISITTICIYHYCVNIKNPGTLFIFANIGYLGVIIFLFHSGYGIAKTYKLNGLKNHFILKRLKKVYFPFVLVNFITLIIYHIFYNKEFSLSDNIIFLLGIKLLDPVLWYVITILLFYTIFYLLFKYFPEKTAIWGLFLFKSS
jgi:peptidoglycan/LPS O-acetylase OafA/YrhL